MGIEEMVYRFKMGLGKLDSKIKTDVAVPKIIIYLNEAMHELVEFDYSVDPRNPLGFEQTQKRIDDLQRLHVTGEKMLPASSLRDIYKFNLKGLKEEYLHLTRLEIMANGKVCTNVVLSHSKQVQTDDINVVLANPYRKPSMAWRRAPYRFASDNIEVFTAGEFSITSVYTDYLRYPKPMDIAGYEHFDGSASTDIDCEMPLGYQSKIVKRAIKNAAVGIEDPALDLKVEQAVDQPL
jgi:hypothetical protein